MKLLPSSSVSRLGLRSGILASGGTCLSQGYCLRLHPWRRESPGSFSEQGQGLPATSMAQGAMSSSLVTRPHFYLRIEKGMNGFHTPPQPILGAKGLLEASLRKNRGASYCSAGSASPACLQGWVWREQSGIFIWTPTVLNV